MDKSIPKKILLKAKQITGKRAKIVVEHILKYGSITTEDLEVTYGYKHPPRAVKDVRDQGLPLAKFSTKNKQGRTIAGYRFGDFRQIRHDRLGGRRTLNKNFIAQLVKDHNNRCAVCNAHYETRYFQIDHKIPYEVAGDTNNSGQYAKVYQPLCGSCNRAKSWSCEHCLNWLEKKKPALCQTCYWANPCAYQHVALQEIRRLALEWQGNEVQDYVKLDSEAHNSGEPMPEYVKKILKQVFKAE